MAGTQESYNLHSLAFALDAGDAAGVDIPTLVEVSVNNYGVQLIDRTGGRAGAEQVVANKLTRPNLQIRGFDTGDLGFLEFIPGTAVDDVACLAADDVGTPDKLANLLADFPLVVNGKKRWMIGAVEIGYDEGTSSTWRATLEVNVLNAETFRENLNVPA